ncbi:hypothetical protein PCE1_004249 [Barthelona sp. PCE]
MSKTRVLDPTGTPVTPSHDRAMSSAAHTPQKSPYGSFLPKSIADWTGSPMMTPPPPAKRSAFLQYQMLLEQLTVESPEPTPQKTAQLLGVLADLTKLMKPSIAELVTKSLKMLVPSIYSDCSTVLVDEDLVIDDKVPYFSFNQRYSDISRKFEIEIDQRNKEIEELKRKNYELSNVVKQKDSDLLIMEAKLDANDMNYQNMKNFSTENETKLLKQITALESVIGNLNTELERSEHKLRSLKDYNVVKLAEQKKLLQSAIADVKVDPKQTIMKEAEGYGKELRNFLKIHETELELKLGVGDVQRVTDGTSYVCTKQKYATGRKYLHGILSAQSSLLTHAIEGSVLRKLDALSIRDEVQLPLDDSILQENQSDYSGYHIKTQLQLKPKELCADVDQCVHSLNECRDALETLKREYEMSLHTKCESKISCLISTRKGQAWTPLSEAVLCLGIEDPNFICSHRHRQVSIPITDDVDEIRISHPRLVLSNIRLVHEEEPVTALSKSTYWSPFRLNGLDVQPPMQMNVESLQKGVKALFDFRISQQFTLAELLHPSFVHFAFAFFEKKFDPMVIYNIWVTIKENRLVYPEFIMFYYLCCGVLSLYDLLMFNEFKKMLEEISLVDRSTDFCDAFTLLTYNMDINEVADQEKQVGDLLADFHVFCENPHLVFDWFDASISHDGEVSRSLSISHALFFGVCNIVKSAQIIGHDTEKRVSLEAENISYRRLGDFFERVCPDLVAPDPRSTLKCFQGANHNDMIKLAFHVISMPIFRWREPLTLREIKAVYATDEDIAKEDLQRYIYFCQMIRNQDMVPWYLRNAQM